MLPALPIVQLVVSVGILLLLAILLLRPRRNETSSEINDQFKQLCDTMARLDTFVRESLSQMRTDALEEAMRTRSESASAASGLRSEVVTSITTLGATLRAGLEQLRTDNRTSAEALRGHVEALRGQVEQRMHSITQGFSQLKDETGTRHSSLRESMHEKLAEMMGSNTTLQDRLRSTVEERLTKLNDANEAKLEQMRLTVDEKLHATLHTRLTESFGQVTDQLNKVHSGLGEMSKLSEGVDGLSRIFTNVKSRGGFAEVQLGMLLRQMLAPGQFIENEVMRPGSLERVEFAVRFPTNSGERLLPIDAKFPREDWERLESAYESGNLDERARAGRAFENAIRTQAEKICSKYINPPRTTPYAIMFLPTEGLYAEVIQRETLQAEIQSKCHVTIAGPTTLSAILTSFQMGFHMLALQEKGDEVWKILEGTKTEFKTFESLMTSMERQVGTVQNTIQKLGVRTRAINRTLREVSDPTALFPDLQEADPHEIDELPLLGFSLAAQESED